MGARHADGVRRGPGSRSIDAGRRAAGNREDRAGEPFVGPAGAVLDRALEDAGIDREAAFVTNVVKHFKWRPVPGSKRRLHDRPSRAEVGACHPSSILRAGPGREAAYAAFVRDFAAVGRLLDGGASAG